MKLVERSEILALGEYEQIRPRFLKRVIALKKVRRVAIGENVTAVFENRDTVLFQIQEMLRTERITSETSIRHEIDTYNELLPSENGVSVTAMIEYTDDDQRDRMLRALVGVEQRFYLAIDGQRHWSQSELRTVDAGRTTAVHYLEFSLSPEAAASLTAGAEVHVGVDHEAYSSEVRLAGPTLSSLRADFEDQG